MHLKILEQYKKNTMTIIDRKVIKDKIRESVEQITGQDIMVRNRERPRVEARYIAFKVMKDTFSRITLNEIARYFDINHATVIHGISQITNWIETDSQLKLIYNGVLYDINTFLENDEAELVPFEDNYVSISKYEELYNRFRILQNLHNNLLKENKQLIENHKRYKRRHELLRDKLYI